MSPAFQAAQSGIRFPLSAPIYRFVMKLFPIACIDDFYQNPDDIREYALSLEYYPSDGGYPGKRTKAIHELDRSLFDHFCGRLMSLYYNFDNTQLNWNIGTYFQLIENMSEDKNSPKNSGWIHQDLGLVFAGIIYLTPGIDPSCGTSIFKLKNEQNYDTFDITVRSKFHTKQIDNNYDETIVKHNSQFIETARFDNYYNRLISFDSDVYHGVTNYYSSTEPRLTQVFFLYNLESSCQTPIERMRNVKR